MSEEEIDLDIMMEDEESLFVDCGYLKPPKTLKKKHNFGTGPKTFDRRFPNPEYFFKEDEEYEFVIFRWNKKDLNEYQRLKNLEKKEKKTEE